jgi:hypothetical protein
LLGGALAVAPVGRPGEAMAGDRGAELAAQAVEIGQGVVAADLEVGDRRLDLRPAALASSIVSRASAPAASTVVRASASACARVWLAYSSAAWRVWRAAASACDSSCAHSFSAPRRSCADSCSVVMRMCAVDSPTSSSLRVTAGSPISLAASVSNQSARRPRNPSTSRLS